MHVSYQTLFMDHGKYIHTRRLHTCTCSGPKFLKGLPLIRDVTIMPPCNKVTLHWKAEPNRYAGGSTPAWPCSCDYRYQTIHECYALVSWKMKSKIEVLSLNTDQTVFMINSWLHLYCDDCQTEHMTCTGVVRANALLLRYLESNVIWQSQTNTWQVLQKHLPDFLLLQNAIHIYLQNTTLGTTKPQTNQISSIAISTYFLKKFGVFLLGWNAVLATYMYRVKKPLFFASTSCAKAKIRSYFEGRSGNM